MQWSVKRRLIYLGLVIVFFALIGAGLWYRYQPAASCSDNKKNQNELGVDCGGPCARVCSFEVRPVQDVWSRLFNIDDTRWDEVTLVKNPNRDYAARDLGYRIRVFDINDVLVTTREGKIFLNPGESFFIYQGRLEIGNRVPKRASFEITSGPVWQRLDRGAVVYPKVTYKSFTSGPTPLLVATIENESLKTLSDVSVSAVLSDADENALAVSSTLVEKLEPREKQEVVFTWPRYFTVEPTFFDFYPHFDPARNR